MSRLLLGREIPPILLSPRPPAQASAHTHRPTPSRPPVSVASPSGAGRLNLSTSTTTTTTTTTTHDPPPSTPTVSATASLQKCLFFPIVADCSSLWDRSPPAAAAVAPFRSPAGASLLHRASPARSSQPGHPSSSDRRTPAATRVTATTPSLRPSAISRLSEVFSLDPTRWLRLRQMSSVSTTVWGRRLARVHSVSFSREPIC